MHFLEGMAKCVMFINPSSFYSPENALILNIWFWLNQRSWTLFTPFINNNMNDNDDLGLQLMFKCRLFPFL